MEIICIVCPNSCKMNITGETVTGNLCKKGAEFAQKEIQNPTRTLTTTVRTISEEMPMLPVRTDKEIPKGLLFEAMKALEVVLVEKEVVEGEVILHNLLGTDCNVIATCDFKL